MFKERRTKIWRAEKHEGKTESRNEGKKNQRNEGTRKGNNKEMKE